MACRCSLENFTRPKRDLALPDYLGIRHNTHVGLVNDPLVTNYYLGFAQLASFEYFSKLKLRDDPNCPWMLTHSPSEAKAYAQLNNKKLILVWEDRRAADRDERLRLYEVISE